MDSSEPLSQRDPYDPEFIVSANRKWDLSGILGIITMHDGKPLPIEDYHDGGRPQIVPTGEYL